VIINRKGRDVSLVVDNK